MYKNSEDEGKTVEFYIPVEEENAVIGFQEETPKPEYTWEDLAKGGRTPTYWIDIYNEWEDLNTVADVANWYAQEFAIANTERNKLREKLDIAREFLDKLRLKEDDDEKSKQISDILNKIK